MRILRFTASTSRPADNTAYQAGDEIANSATAGSVVRASFDLSGFSRGSIKALACSVTPASGNLVITALNFDALIYKSADAPAAVGDNVTFPLTGLQRTRAVGRFLFDNDGWQNTLGAYTAGTSGFQAVAAGYPVPLASPTLYEPHPPGFVFEFKQGEAQTLVLALQALAAWTPTGIVNAFEFALDVEAE